MSGYLDEVLCIFKEHDHPFVLVGSYAMRWHYISRRGRKDIIEVLVSHQETLSIAQSLVETGHWIFCPSARRQSPNRHPNPSQGTWLRHLGGGFGPGGDLEYLQFRSENPYFLPINSCLEFEVPDFFTLAPVTMEEEYNRDPHRRFGPKTWESFDEPLLIDKFEYESEYENEYEIEWESEWESEDGIEDRKTNSDAHPALCKEIMARSPSVRVPIFVPSVSAHVNALLQQAQYKVHSGTLKDVPAMDRLYAYVLELFLDWPPTARWFLDTKVTESNRKFMEEFLNSFLRCDQVLFQCRKTPWELEISPEWKTQCDERCDYCKDKEEGRCKSELETTRL